MSTIDFDYFCHDAIQKITVMGDDKYRAFIVDQICLQPCNRFHIQVIGRLIKKNYIRVGQQQTPERHTGFLSAG